MRVALGAYRLMELVAESHGGIDEVEARVLAAYRRALALSPADLAELHAADPTALAIEGDDREREETIRAMARVAAADGLLSPRERGYLIETAERLDLGRVRAANLITEEAGAASRPRRTERPRVVLVGAVVLAPLLVWFLMSRAERVSLQEIARAGDRALVLLDVDYTLTKGAEHQRFHGEGTAFFVGDDGLLLTCKHVVQPWKFLADKRALLDQGWVLEPGSIRWRAYSVGAPMKSTPGPEDPKVWDSLAGDLQLVRLAEDRWVRGNRSLPQGGRHRGTYHALGNTDLALLRASGDVPEGLALAPAEHRPEPLDEVVVLGFPKGAELLEGSRALSAPSIGVVRRIEDTILISGDTFPGNSGGPCLDVEGRVIGIVARRAGDESLGRCLRTMHAWALLEGVTR